MDQHPSRSTETQTVRQSSPTDGSALPLAIKKQRPKDYFERKILGRPSDGNCRTSSLRAQKNEALNSTVGFDMPEPPCLLEQTAQPLNVCMPQREEISYSNKTLAPKATHVDRHKSVLPDRKLCLQCRRQVFESTSLCTKCIQMKDDERKSRLEVNGSDEHMGFMDLHTMSTIVPPTHVPISPLLNEADVACKNKMTRRALPRKPHSRDDIGSTLTHDHKHLPGSTIVPEIPDVVSEPKDKSLDFLRDGEAKAVADKRRLTKPRVPQKRLALDPLMTDNDHCFNKKKPRIFRPTTKSRATNIGPMQPNQLPPAPKSCSPHFQHCSQEAHVQKTQAIFSQSKASMANGASYGAERLSPHSRRKSEQCHIKSRSSKLLEQQGKRLARRTEQFEQADAATSRLKTPVQKSGPPPRHDLSIQKEYPCTLERDGNIVSHHTTNLCGGPIEKACNWTLSDEKGLLKTLQNRGVMFENDSSYESDISMPPPQTKPIPKDPLWRRPQSSADVFLLAPGLDANHSSFAIERRRKEIAARPCRKERRMNISYLRQERGDNIHEEVKRTCSPRMVKIFSVIPAEIGDFVDENAEGMGADQPTEVEVSFSEFIGAPAKPMPILSKDKQLAFRDGTRDAKGDLPRAREKFIVTSKSVGCMEN